MSENTEKASGKKREPAETTFYRIRFRQEGQEFTLAAKISGLHRDDVVMVQTDHGLEPARIAGNAPSCKESECERKASYVMARRPSQEEITRYDKIASSELNAYKICSGLIEKHKLHMSLVKVERFFNGSKMIFFFTADNRVDFRALVKDLVQEFRTRVEMRQVGVRHETKMIGGIGTCGRQLCCSSFIKNFDSVSIKMAKEQDLPLNPSKISGVCNRLLCCLTYEYDTYKRQRKKMPKPGKRISINDEQYKVKRQHPLQQTIVVMNAQGEDMVLAKDEWQNFKPVAVDHKPKKEKKKKEFEGKGKGPGKGKGAGRGKGKKRSSQ